MMVTMIDLICALCLTPCGISSLSDSLPVLLARYRGAEERHQAVRPATEQMGPQPLPQTSVLFVFGFTVLAGCACGKDVYAFRRVPSVGVCVYVFVCGIV